MSKIFIPGAAGFIGGHLWDSLEKKGHEVCGIDNFSHASSNPKNNRVKYGDIRYYQDIEKYVEWSDITLLVAAQIHVDKSITNPEETIDVNVKGTLNVLEAVKKYDKRMVFASSSEVYGSSQSQFMGESHPLDAQSPYAASKLAGDRLCKAYYDTFGTRVTILRNFNTFGEYQNDTSYGGVIAIFTRKALAGEPLTIYGSGRQERDYMYIDNAVRAYEFCMENPALIGRAVNVGSGKTITINDLAAMIIKLTNSKSEIIHIEPRAGEVMRLCADMTFACSNGFSIMTDFEKELNAYVSWYRDFAHLGKR